MYFQLAGSTTHDIYHEHLYMKTTSADRSESQISKHEFEVGSSATLVWQKKVSGIFIKIELVAVLRFMENVNVAYTSFCQLYYSTVTLDGNTIPHYLNSP